MKDVAIAVSEIFDGATILTGGFGDAGAPNELLEALAERKDVRHLKVVSNNAGVGNNGLARLFLNDQVERLICSFPLGDDPSAFRASLEKGVVKLELVPQGTLAERIRAAGAGLGGVLTPTGVGTEFAMGKQVLKVDEKEYLLEKSLEADFALIKALKADKWGNLIYRHAARNFNPLMATAAKVTIAQVKSIAEEPLPPDEIHTPGIFVDRFVKTGT